MVRFNRTAALKNKGSYVELRNHMKGCDFNSPERFNLQGQSAAPLFVGTLHNCTHQCDLTPACGAAVYNSRWKQCILQGPCKQALPGSCTSYDWCAYSKGHANLPPSIQSLLSQAEATTESPYVRLVGFDWDSWVQRLEKSALAPVETAQPSNRSKVLLLATVSLHSDPELLPHFVKHYTTLGLSLQGSLWLLEALPGKSDVEREKDVALQSRKHMLRLLRAWLQAKGARAQITHAPEGSVAALSARLKLLQHSQLPRDGWVVQAHAYEMHEFPLDPEGGSLADHLVALDERGVALVRGNWIDRLSIDGNLINVSATTPLSERFPLRCYAMRTLQTSTTRCMAYQPARVTCEEENSDALTMGVIRRYEVYGGATLRQYLTPRAAHVYKSSEEWDLRKPLLYRSYRYAWSAYDAGRIAAISRTELHSGLQRYEERFNLLKRLQPRGEGGGGSAGWYWNLPMCLVDAKRQRDETELSDPKACPDISCQVVRRRKRAALAREEAGLETVRRRQEATVRAAEEFERMMNESARELPTHVCGAAPLFTEADAQPVPSTQSSMFRYFSIFECGSAAEPLTCITYKPQVNSAVVFSANGTDGINFGDTSVAVPADMTWHHKIISHNLAVLRLQPESEGRYAIMGGMQGFGTHKKHQLPYEENPNFGVRIAVGQGWPYREPQWARPVISVRGTEPGNCIDKRPPYTGWPKLKACEFDGRLALVQHRSLFRLYARANVKFGAKVGGRFVQTTTSETTKLGSWKPWQMVEITGLPMGTADLYFFHVQSNPLDPSSLLALFPISQPPQACIGLAFSADGVHFSRPYNLRKAVLGWRTANADGTGRIEWRAEDHPGAGMVLRTDRRSGRKVAWFYVQHTVHGLSMRVAAVKEKSAHLSRYVMPQDKLLELTKKGLAELNASGA